MQLQMTERDKRLIVLLAVFIILVAGGYWGIYPAVTGIIATNEKIAEARELQVQNDFKIAQLPLISIDNERKKEELKSLKEEYFPMMTSAQVDRYFTELVLSYGLNSYDLEIQMPEGEAAVEPYQYSQKARGGGASGEMEMQMNEVEQVMAEAEGEDPSDPSAAFIDVSEVSTGIHEVAVSMRVGGDEKKIQKLIDDLSVTDQKLHLRSFSWGKEDAMDFGLPGTFEMKEEKNLTMNINLYMCEE